MSFIQIIDLTTDRPDDVRAVDAEWQAATAGRNTLQREAIYVDRDRPGHYLSICEFESYEQAMGNSQLPETGRAAERIAAVSEQVGFVNLDLVEVLTDRRTEYADRLLESVRHGHLDTEMFAADVETEFNVPFALMKLSGVDALAGLLRQGFPYGAEVLEHRSTATGDGVLVEFSARTVTGPDHPESTYSREIVRLELRDGRVGRFTLYCTGDWDAATQAEQLGAATSSTG